MTISAVTTTTVTFPCTTKEQVDERVMAHIRENPGCLFAAIRDALFDLRIEWREIDRSLQRLRKRKAINSRGREGWFPAEPMKGAVLPKAKAPRRKRPSQAPSKE